MVKMVTISPPPITSGVSPALLNMDKDNLDKDIKNGILALYRLILNLMPATHSKTLGQGHVYYCVTVFVGSFSFNNTKDCINHGHQ